VVFPEEGLDRQRAQFDADHVVALFGQPEHVQALAAQRDEHAAGRGRGERGPEAAEQQVDTVLVEIGAALAPELQPALVVVVGHGVPC
jgi:hypothetical protein